MSNHHSHRGTDLSFQKGKGFRKDVGKEIDRATGRTKYKRFWLGRDEPKARDLGRLVVAEWKLIRAHGGQVWTAEALARIDRAKTGQTNPLTSGALAPVPPPVLAPAVLAPPLPEPQPSTLSEGTAAPTAPPPGPTAGGTLLYDAIAAYEALFKQEAASGQLSDGRWLNVSYAMERLKYAMPDRPLATIGFNEIRQVVGHFTSRPISKSTKRKYAADTVIDTLTFVRSLFTHLADTGQWLAPAPLKKLFKYYRLKLYTDAELEARQQVKVYDIADLTKLWRSCPNDLRQLLFLLGLNCGFTQTDVATLRPEHCHLEGPKPFIRRSRHKTRILGQWRLWPETAALLRKVIAKHTGKRPLLTARSGRPLVYYEGRIRYDSARKEWLKILDRANRDPAAFFFLGRPRLRPAHYVAPVFVRRLGFKYLRKTGGNLIRKIAGRETSEVYLSHADPKMARPYTNKDFVKLAKALRKMRHRLDPVLGALAENTVCSA